MKDTKPGPLVRLPVHVLLVDDHPANLLALEAALEPLGLDLVKASSGEEALRRLEVQDFAVVLLDVRMHGLDGFETAKRIRQREKNHLTPLIFLTGFQTEDAEVIKAYRLGAVDFLIKPLVPEILRAKVMGFVELFRNAARIERQAQLLRESEERYRLLVEQVQDYAILMLDPKGHVVTWNMGAERLKGYTAGEIVGRHFSAFYPPDKVAQGWPEQELTIATAEGRFEDEGWRVRKDGTRFWANVVITALYGSEGGFRGFVKVTRDLTQRVLAEEQARQLALEQAARAQAEEGVKARDRFLSIASHELRTPLNPLKINLQLLLRASRDSSPNGRLAGRTVGILETCERQVNQFSNLVNDLLDVARIAAGRLELRREDVDLAAVARDVAAGFGPEFERAGCSLGLRADAPAVGHWDRSRLDQVVTNLVSNAIKYGRGRPVEITVEPDAEAARLTVRDHGIGIAPEDQDRIFMRFERAVTDHDYSGLGMGLYIVRQVVDALGGTIRVASEPGAGAAFTVELPYAPPARERAEGATGATKF